VEVEASELGADNELMKDALAEDIVEITCEARSEFREDSVFNRMIHVTCICYNFSAVTSSHLQKFSLSHRIKV
jgi:hypothetical protein